MFLFYFNVRGQTARPQSVWRDLTNSNPNAGDLIIYLVAGAGARTHGFVVTLLA